MDPPVEHVPNIECTQSVTYGMDGLVSQVSCLGYTMHRGWEKNCSGSNLEPIALPSSALTRPDGLVASNENCCSFFLRKLLFGNQESEI